MDESARSVKGVDNFMLLVEEDRRERRERWDKRIFVAIDGWLLQNESTEAEVRHSVQPQPHIFSCSSSS